MESQGRKRIVVWEWYRGNFGDEWQVIDSKELWQEANQIVRKRCADALKEATEYWGSPAYVDLSKGWMIRVRNMETGNTWKAWDFTEVKWMPDRDLMDGDPDQGRCFPND